MPTLLQPGPRSARRGCDAAGREQGLGWAVCRRHGGGSSGGVRGWRREQGEPFPAAEAVGARGVSGTQAVLSVTGVH